MKRFDGFGFGIILGTALAVFLPFCTGACPTDSLAQCGDPAAAARNQDSPSRPARKQPAKRKPFIDCSWQMGHSSNTNIDYYDAMGFPC